jgi:anion-transporting ATPase
MAMARLILVTGKGGTGKSAVAAALALSLARLRPTVLVDLDQRGWAARMLGIGPGDDPKIHHASRNGTDAIANLETVSLSASAELEEFIQRLVPIKAVARRMLQSRTFGYVSAALPGLEAFLMLERLRIVAGRAALEDYYAVVDAPATGTTLELLAVPAALRRLAPLGTLNRLAANVESFLADATRFAVMLTLTPHELALREALEASDVLRGRLGISVAAAALNCVPPPLFSQREIEHLDAARIDSGCARLAHWRHGGGAGATTRARRAAVRAGLGLVELPMLFSPAMGRTELGELSRALDVWLAGILPGASRGPARQPAGPGKAAHPAPPVRSAKPQ